VGTPASFMICFEKILLPSIRAAAWLGPNTFRPSASSRSVSPAQSGASGPMMVRSGLCSRAQAMMAARSLAAMCRLVESAAVPAFPGAQTIRGRNESCAIFHANACSRPPEPTMRMRGFCFRQKLTCGPWARESHHQIHEPYRARDQ